MKNRSDVQTTYACFGHLSLILGGLFLLVCYGIAPNQKRDVSAFRGKKYAHRGLHNSEVPENSLWAFRRAVEKHFGVELDVQMTKDGLPVVFHDGTLKRMCGVEGSVKDYTYDELCKLNLKETNETIPLLRDVLEVLGDTDLICEIKSDNGVKNYELCEKAYELLKAYKGNYCIESFSPYLVEWFKKNHPGIIRGQLSCHVQGTGHGKVSDWMLTNLLVHYLSRPDFIAYEFRDAKKSFGLRLVRKLFNPFCICWTPKGEEEIAQALKEFDTIIFEDDSL